MSGTKKDVCLPTVRDLATLAASMNQAGSADKRADMALRVWFASKHLLEIMASKISECPQEDRALLHNALDSYTDSDVPLDEVFEWRKQNETVSYDEAKKISGIRTDETFHNYLAKVLRGEPTKAELKKERRIRSEDSVHVPSLSELKRDGIHRSVLSSMMLKKRHTKSETGRKSRSGKRAAGADAKMVNGCQGSQPTKGGKSVN